MKQKGVVVAKTLSEQLVALGLVNGPDPARASRQKVVVVRATAGKPGEMVVGDDEIRALGDCASVQEFRQMVAGILQREPSRIGEIITAAHVHKEKDGGKRIVWEMYQIRDGLTKCSSEKLERFLKRATRRSGRKFTLPE